MSRKRQKFKFSQDDLSDFIEGDNFPIDLDYCAISYLVRYKDCRDYFYYDSIDDIAWDESIKDLVIDYGDDDCFLWRNGRWITGKSDVYRDKSSGNQFNSSTNKSKEYYDDADRCYYEEYAITGLSTQQSSIIDGSLSGHTYSSFIEINKIDNPSLEFGADIKEINTEINESKNKYPVILPSGNLHVLDAPPSMHQSMWFSYMMQRYAYNYLGINPWNVFIQLDVFDNKKHHSTYYTKKYVDLLKTSDVAYAKVIFAGNIILIYKEKKWFAEPIKQQKLLPVIKHGDKIPLGK